MKAREARYIHVAGVLDLSEAQLLIDCGVEHLGFPLFLDHHQEDLTVNAAAEIVSKLGNRATFFLITYLNKAKAIRALCEELSVNLVQLHGHIEREQLQLLRQAAPKLRIIKSLIVRGENVDRLIDEVQHYGPSVDAFITDTYDPITGASGATGKTHDWEISRILVNASKKPVILAGGLNDKNVRRAIDKVRPAGVDVHTGIEGPDGRKCRDLVKRFLDEAYAGFAEIEPEPSGGE